jgi:hypothetical protein
MDEKDVRIEKLERQLSEVKENVVCVL